MSLAMPQYSMAVTLPTDFNIAVTVSAVSFTGTVPAGTYFIDESGTADDFLAVLATSLTTNDVSGTWNAVLGTQPSGLDGTVILTRTGTSVTLTQMDFDAGEGQIVGASQDTYTGGEAEFTSSSGTVIVWRGDFQTRYIWRPRDYQLRSEFKPRRTISRSRSVTGRVVTDGYSLGWHDRPIVINPVQGCLVYQWMADDSVFAVVDGMTAGDPNIALEQFWLDLMAQSNTSGTPPVVRMAPDVDDLATFQNIWMSDGDWLESLESAVEEVSPEPALYRVNFLAQTVVA